jgi:hypothetical protein
MKNQVRISDIITSESTMDDEESSFLLGLYYVVDSENRFYHYSGPIENEYVKQLTEIYINNFAFLKVFSTNMYSSSPLHIVRYFQPFNNINSTVLAYYNGGVCLDQFKDSKLTIHLWIDKETVKFFDIIKPEDFNKLILNMPL